MVAFMITASSSAACLIFSHSSLSRSMLCWLLSTSMVYSCSIRCSISLEVRIVFFCMVSSRSPGNLTFFTVKWSTRTPYGPSSFSFMSLTISSHPRPCSSKIWSWFTEDAKARRFSSCWALISPSSFSGPKLYTNFPESTTLKTINTSTFTVMLSADLQSFTGVSNTTRDLFTRYATLWKGEKVWNPGSQGTPPLVSAPNLVTIASNPSGMCT
mmetsp:Transcript_4286/g.8842  ORF Transcript_4286/g.8842 Transcript_4286/m.8842 type:complete len:213 (+) Transcript_4286:791-1429(+)